MYKSEIHGLKVKCIDISANDDNGFNFPIRIFIPDNLNDNSSLIFGDTLPRNDVKCSLKRMSKDALDDIHRTEEHAYYYCSVDPTMMHLLKMGNPLMLAGVPNIHGIRTRFLGSKEYKLSDENKRQEVIQEIKKYNPSFSDEDISKFFNLDLQYKNMIVEAINELHKNNINVDDKVIMNGYSEGSKFSSHFALLHPEVVKAVIGGGTGGCMSMPVKELEGYEFIYPTGIADLDNFNEEEFKKIKFFYYMGDKDFSDSARPAFEYIPVTLEDGTEDILRDECGNPSPRKDEKGNPILTVDENGNYKAQFSLFTDGEVNSINKVLGVKTQDRFIKQEQIYKDLGLDATFKMYPADHRTIFSDENRTIIEEDINDFINSLSKERTR